MLPGNYPGVDKILRYSLTPEITEEKVMAGRLVFRGKGKLHILYSDADGGIHSWDTEIPFSQYTELDRDHSTHAQGWIMVILTNLEVERQEERKLAVKASMAAQYVIYDRVMVDVVEDAYSPLRSVELTVQELNLPVRLDSKREMLHMQQTMTAGGQRLLDVSWQAEHPVRRQSGDVTEVVLPGQFQTLYIDENGNVQFGTARAETAWQISSDEQNTLDAYCHAFDAPQAAFAADFVEFTVDVAVEAAVFSEEGIPMVTALDIGELQEPDPGRPSVILRRAGEKCIWDIAKECGSTVDAIKKANQIQEEPENGKMLLIPVP